MNTFKRNITVIIIIKTLFKKNYCGSVLQLIPLSTLSLIFVHHCQRHFVGYLSWRTGKNHKANVGVALSDRTHYLLLVRRKWKLWATRRTRFIGIHIWHTLCHTCDRFTLVNYALLIIQYFQIITKNLNKS